MKRAFPGSFKQSPSESVRPDVQKLPGTASFPLGWGEAGNSARLKRRAGFSMLELLVVLAIVGILSATTWPRVSRLMAHYRLDGAARALMADAQKARFRAIAERKCFQIKFDSPVPAGSFQVRTDPGIGNCTAGSFTTVDGAKEISSGVALTITSTANPIFDTRGTVNTIATITLTNAHGASRQVRIEATGRVRIV